jgi:hypothetical protein
MKGQAEGNRTSLKLEEILWSKRRFESCGTASSIERNSREITLVSFVEDSEEGSPVGDPRRWQPRHWGNNQ